MHDLNFFSSPEPKAGTYLITICPLSVVVDVLVVLNFSHFHLLQDHWGNFNQTWHKASLGDGDSIFLKRIGHTLFQRKMITKKRNLKIFSRTTEPISTTLGANCPWEKGIQDCSHEGPRPFSR